MLRPDNRLEYRARIYDRYVTAHVGGAVPKTPADIPRYLHYFRRLVRKYFPQDRGVRILDLGCGYGIFIRALHEAGYNNVRGVDCSYEQVRTADHLGISGVEHGELQDTLEQTPAESVDVAICFDVIEHFTKGELPSLIDSVYRILKHGGRWLIHVPNAESPFWGRVRYGDYTHEQAFTRESLAQVLVSSGFENVLCFEDRPVVHGVKSAIRAILWYCVRALLLAYIAVETGAVDGKNLFSQNILAIASRP